MCHAKVGSVILYSRMFVNMSSTFWQKFLDVAIQIVLGHFVKKH